MSLDEILELQQAELAVLLAALLQERELLSMAAPDGAALEQTAQSKAESFETLRSLEADLATLQQDLGLAGGAEGLQAAAQREHCHSLLHTVRDTAHRVFQLNQINGVLVKKRLALNERLLGFIRDAHDSWTYGPKGHRDQQRSTMSSSA